MLYKLHSSLNRYRLSFTGAHLLFLRLTRWDKSVSQDSKV